MAFTSPIGLAMVLLGREPEARSCIVIKFVIENTPGWLEELELGKVSSLATSDETVGVEELVLTFGKQMALLRD
ncbi:hypothetical protein Tco_0968955 [Tanacetum coccineum]